MGDTSISGGPAGNNTRVSISTKDIFLICGADCLEPYKKFINVDKINLANKGIERSEKSGSLSDNSSVNNPSAGPAFADQVRAESMQPVDQSIFCRPLSFDAFFGRCKEKLNFVFIN